MCEFNDNSSEMNEVPESNEVQKETEMPEMNEIPEETESGESMESAVPLDEIPEDTQSDFEKINHPNMSLEEVQGIQGIDENGNTIGEGTGNEMFKDSLPEDYKSPEDGQPSDEYRQTVDDNYADMENQINDSYKAEGWNENMQVHDDDWSKPR